jgi:hypothetical protein
VLTLAVYSVMDRGYDVFESLLVVLGMFIVLTIIQAFQLPLFFKLGYSKAKILTYLPLVGIPIVIFVIKGLFPFADAVSEGSVDTANAPIADLFGFLADNPVLLVVIVVVVWLAIMFASYRMSLRFYSRREF